MSITKTNQKKEASSNFSEESPSAERCIYVTDHLPCQVVVGSKDFKNAGLNIPFEGNANEARKQGAHLFDFKYQ